MEQEEGAAEVIPTIRLLWLHTNPYLPSRIQESMDIISQMSSTADICDIRYLQKEAGENYIPQSVKETLEDDPFCYLIILMEGPEETQSKRSFQILGELEELVKLPNINPRQIQCHFPIYAGPSVYRKRNIETDKIIARELHKLRIIPVPAARVPRDIAIGRRTCWGESTFGIYQAIRKQFSYDSLKFWRTRAELRPSLKHQSEATFINRRVAERKILCIHCGGDHRAHHCDCHTQAQPPRATRWENHNLKLRADMHMQRSKTQLPPEQEEIGVDMPNKGQEAANKAAVPTKNNDDKEQKKKKARKDPNIQRVSSTGSPGRDSGQGVQVAEEIPEPDPAGAAAPMEEDQVDEKPQIKGGQLAQSMIRKVVPEPQSRAEAKVKQEPTEEGTMVETAEKAIPNPGAVIHNPPGVSELYNNPYYVGPKTSSTNI